MLLKFVLLAILLECAVTKGGGVVAIVVVGSIDDVGVVGADADAVAGPAGGGVVAPFFNRMDFVADAVVILMLFLTLLCEYVIVISLLSSLSLQSFTQCAFSLKFSFFFALLSVNLEISTSISPLNSDLLKFLLFAFFVFGYSLN